MFFSTLNTLPLTMWVSLIGLFGLLIGSFLNVVIYRLPLMLQYEWEEECHRLPEHATELGKVQPSRFDLLFPASHCPHCHHPLSWWENIPVLSFVWQRGHCRHCHTPISWQYPLIELVSALGSAWIAYSFKITPHTLMACLFFWVLLSAVIIDFQHQLLPDLLNYILLWCGLLYNTQPHGWTPLPEAVIGAAVGYLSLWSLYWIFKILTHKEGMGYGDFKLFAALGAWFGWQSLPSILLLAGLSASLFGIVMMLMRQFNHNTPMPFGPFLAFGGMFTLFLGQKIQLFFVMLSI